MAQPTETNVQNGIPYKWDGTKGQLYPYALNNGVGSTQSSRDSSPVPRFSNVPLSQLPPPRNQIPSTQLPPSRPPFSPIAPIAGPIGSLGPHGQPGFKGSTPHSSPKISTSTPRTDASYTGSFSLGGNMPNIVDRISPVQSDSNRGNLLTNPNPQEKQFHGNLLTNQLEPTNTPSFIPVSAPVAFPHENTVPVSASNKTSQEPLKPQLIPNQGMHQSHSQPVLQNQPSSSPNPIHTSAFAPVGTQKLSQSTGNLSGLPQTMNQQFSTSTQNIRSQTRHYNPMGLNQRPPNQYKPTQNGSGIPLTEANQINQTPPLSNQMPKPIGPPPITGSQSIAPPTNQKPTNQSFTPSLGPIRPSTQVGAPNLGQVSSGGQKLQQPPTSQSLGQVTNQMSGNQRSTPPIQSLGQITSQMSGNQRSTPPMQSGIQSLGQGTSQMSGNQPRSTPPIQSLGQATSQTSGNLTRPTPSQPGNPSLGQVANLQMQPLGPPGSQNLLPTSTPLGALFPIQSQPTQNLAKPLGPPTTVGQLGPPANAGDGFPQVKVPTSQSMLQQHFGPPPTNTSHIGPFTQQSGLSSQNSSQPLGPPPANMVPLPQQSVLTNQNSSNVGPPLTCTAPPFNQQSGLPNQSATQHLGPPLGNLAPPQQSGLTNQNLNQSRSTESNAPFGQQSANSRSTNNMGQFGATNQNQSVNKSMPQAQYGALNQNQPPKNMAPPPFGQFGVNQHVNQSLGPPPVGQQLATNQQLGPPPVNQSMTPSLGQQSGPTNQQLGPPPINQSMAPPSLGPTNQQVRPPVSQSMAPPPVGQQLGSANQHLGPPVNQGMPPPPVGQQLGTTNQHLGPPVNQSMAPVGQQLGTTNQHLGQPVSQSMAPPPTNQNIGPPPTNQSVAPPLIGQQLGPSAGQNTNFMNQNQMYNQSQGQMRSGNQNPSQVPTSSQNVPQMPPGYNKNDTNQTIPLIPTSQTQVMQNKYNAPQKQEFPTTPTSSLYGKRYPQQKSYNQAQNVPNQMNQNYQTGYKQTVQSYQSYGQGYQNLNQGMQNMNLGQSGFNRMLGTENFDLLQSPNILPTEKLEPPKVCLGQEFLNAANCSSEIFRCTMTKIPESNSLLQKSRLPLGVLIHPFKDLNHLPVIQCSTIVRCRACRTYINPFVFFVDTKRWKCNLCYRVNDLPEEFQYDPVSKSYGDPSRRPEIKASTIEYIAPSEYMLRPPQPAVYLFLLDISRLAVESGYLYTVCEVLTSQLSQLPGDGRTQIGFLAYNSTLHFFSLGEGLSQPHEMTVLDIDDVFLPCPDNLLVNLKERMDLVTDLLALLPTRYINSYDSGSALGAALQAAFKMMSATGGRVTVFQAALPTLGPGALTSREDPNQRAGKEAPHLNPATDFYKRLALECSGHQIAVDLFVVNSQYVDIATLSGISRFSGGCIHHFPFFKASKPDHSETLERSFKRYLTRKIGFEAVMRIRCTRGLAVHTFHGNFFVRSTDLLSLPNVNPDAGFGMQVSIEESLTDLQSVCFQAALLYTSSKGERRIRVHTLCLPVVNTIQDVLNSADQQCIVGVLAKMAVDRSLQSSLSDARDAFINVAIDILHSYKASLNMGDAGNGLLASNSLKLLPLYILALLKHVAFRSGHSTRLDDRVFAMCEMKTLPLQQLMQQVYPDLYPIHNLTDEGGYVDPDGVVVPQPPRLQLTSRNIDAYGVYLLDGGPVMIIFVCQNVAPAYLTHVLGVPNFNAIPDQCHELPKLDNAENQRLHTFIAALNDEKSYSASLHIMRENSPNRTLFLEKLIEDRIESALSYNEFLQHVKTQVK